MRSHYFKFTPFQKNWCHENRQAGIRPKRQRGYSPIIMRSTTTAQKIVLESVYLANAIAINFVEVSRLEICRRWEVPHGRAFECIVLMPELWPNPLSEGPDVAVRRPEPTYGSFLWRKVLTIFVNRSTGLQPAGKLLRPCWARATVVSKAKEAYCYR